MARMGHSSPAAALRYQHATRERDRAIADRMNDLIGSRAHETIARQPVSDSCHESGPVVELRDVSGP